MGSINTNVDSLIALHTLSKTHQGLGASLTKLATGLKINSGKDDPAGLIAGEYLKAEIAALEASMNNAQRADQVLSTADGGLSQVGGMLAEVQGLVVASADSTLSDSERAANQMQIDSLLDSIDRISGTTTFGGNKLLDGSKGYTVSDVDTANVADHEIFSASGVGSSGLDVNVDVTQAAENAGLFMAVDDGTSVVGDDGTIEFELTGSQGSQTFTFSAGTSYDDMAAAVNEWSESTGVTAEAYSAGGNDGLRFMSQEMGSDESVALRIIDDGGRTGDVYQLQTGQADPTQNGEADLTAATSLADLEGQGPAYDEGVDVGGTINGHVAAGDGQTLTVDSSGLDMRITLRQDAAKDLTGGSFDAMTITGGGSSFAIGPDVSASGMADFGLPAVNTGRIGRINEEHSGQMQSYSLADLRSGGSLSMTSGSLGKAQQAVNQAIGDVSFLRGRIGAFQANVIAPSIRANQLTLENTSEAKSSIVDTDYAKETANQMRFQILAQAGTGALAMANSNATSVLNLFM
ncbi:MAG: flagellin [Phycisphaerae bacterium]|nr:flagellin [Phycisphaerae bacterium]